MKRLALIHLVLVASLACDKNSNDDENGSDTGSEEGESGPSTGSETGSNDAETGATDSTDETGGSACPDTFPLFDKTCTMDSDCTLVLHTTTCCGTNVAWGIATSEVPAFDEVEAACDAEFPECDCAPLPTVAE